MSYSYNHLMDLATKFKYCLLRCDAVYHCFLTDVIRAASYVVTQKTVTLILYSSVLL